MDILSTCLQQFSITVIGSQKSFIPFLCRRSLLHQHPVPQQIQRSGRNHTVNKRQLLINTLISRMCIFNTKNKRPKLSITRDWFIIYICHMTAWMASLTCLILCQWDGGGRGCDFTHYIHMIILTPLTQSKLMKFILVAIDSISILIPCTFCL